MAISEGVVWQLGDRGRLYTSQDLDQWMPHETGTLKSLRGIAFRGTNVFISADEGTILPGARPNPLTLRTLPTTNWLEGIAASPNTIVAVGDNGAIYSSANGATWTARGNYTTWLRSVAYGDNQFLAVGEDGFIASSSNGQNWQLRTSGTTAHLNSVAWLLDRFWVVGDNGTVLTNTAQMSFAPVNVGAVTNTLFSVAANSNDVVIAGELIVLLGNRAGGSWTRQSDVDSPTLAPEWPYYSALWDGRLFLLGGDAGMIVEGFRTNANGPMGWYSAVQPTRSWLWAVTRVGGLYAAAGVNGTIVTSEDGVEWAREAVPDVALDEILLGIGGNTNLLIAAGSNGMLLRSENSFTNVVSTNSNGELVTNVVSLLGLIWTQSPIATTEDLQGVPERNGTFVVTGGAGKIFTSANGLVWQPRLSGVSTFLSGATGWPNGFAVVGASGTILTSTDGTLWVPRSSGVRNWIYSVRYAGGKLIAVGEDGLILTSENGVGWTRRDSGTTEWLNDVTYASGFWQVAGSGGTIVTSTDAANWTAARTMTSKSLYGAATDGDQVIMAGLDGAIIRRWLSTPNTPVNFLSFDQVAGNSLFLFAGEIDQQFVLEASASLTGPWSPLRQFEITDLSQTLLYELAGQALPMRFFRTRLLAAP